ncbi:TPA: pilus assembly protein CpaB [Vibrio vulnificus]|uniref:pilus assembly protein CpaB n=1 Tax=Vibrio vulnificus TaxID=672 RepID=UPI001A19D6BA|nr:pilus assembly protein CpaB [Vibrio vulnificus]HDY7422108.1 pilus assembly protein CpaB [Vibrio vulnificus]HDY7495730.1 pilus assembly protein CpaB [Vibrio vulnificus]HDY7599800.1 pilus assembly protein CpaB [Vibrio vulnificus]HDY7709533.1 pilus assembly protein CpaB [Vibrio vulnificus]
MNRYVVILSLSATIFASIFFFLGDIVPDDRNNAEVPIDEPTVLLLELIKDVEKSEEISDRAFREVEVGLSEVHNNRYTLKSELDIQPGALFNRNLVTGTKLSNAMISNPGDRDYMFLSLKKDEVPYYYEPESSNIIENITLQPGDSVSFVSTTSSKSNLLETGYQDIGDLVSKIIISDAKVIQVIKSEKDSKEPGTDKSPNSLVIALKVPQVLKLEMAQKIGDISIVPSSVAKRYLSIRSSDILEDQFGVRELRGKE